MPTQWQAGTPDTNQPPNLICGADSNNLKRIILTDINGNVNVNIANNNPTGIIPVVSSALEANHVLKASPGNLYGFQITNGATAGYVMLYDATTAPVDGAVTPVKCYQLPANSTLVAGFGPPLAFSTGIVVGFSSTGPFTKTASATVFISGEVI